MEKKLIKYLNSEMKKQKIDHFFKVSLREIKADGKITTLRLNVRQNEVNNTDMLNKLIRIFPEKGGGRWFEDWLLVALGGSKYVDVFCLEFKKI